MTLNFNVRTTKDFKFNPTTLRIDILPGQTLIEDDMIRIMTTSIHNLEDGTGTITETRYLEVPKNFLEVLNGFNTITMMPTCDDELLNGILSTFNLELDK